jgi:hypothetical protein
MITSKIPYICTIEKLIPAAQTNSDIGAHSWRAQSLLPYIAEFSVQKRVTYKVCYSKI